jgi:peptide/nickel transport system substrate-binding protein
MKLKVVFQTSINAPRQKNQEIVKQACQKAGIDVELKTVPASVFFSSDVGNPDTYTKFYTDIQMYTTTMAQPDPRDFMRQFLLSEVASKDNKWQGRNITRYQNADYDKLYATADNETDPVKRAALFIQMNDMLIKDLAVIPDQYRPSVAAISNKLHALPSAWDSYIWNFYDWYADA